MKTARVNYAYVFIVLSICFFNLSVTNSDSMAVEGILLDIPDRKQDPEKPPEGWCGEAAIQILIYIPMIFLLHYITFH